MSWCKYYYQKEAEVQIQIHSGQESLPIIGGSNRFYFRPYDVASVDPEGLHVR